MMDNLQGYKKVIGWFGLITGVLNLLFWAIMGGLYYANDYGEPFFNSKFYKRCYAWGIFVLIAAAIALVISLFL